MKNRYLLSEELIKKTQDTPTPFVFFDKELIRLQTQILSEICTAHNFRMLMPVKAFPAKEFIELIQPFVSGFHINHMNETKLTTDRKWLWFCSNGRFDKTNVDLLKSKKTKFITINNQTQIEQLQEFKIRTDQKLILRLQTTGRFGFTESQFKSLSKKLLSQIHGIHFHFVDPYTSSAAILEYLQSWQKLFVQQKWQPQFINVGGGYLHFQLQEIGALLNKVRSIMGQESEYFIEPGRLLTRDCGYAVATILAINRSKDFDSVILDISADSHLKWSVPKVVNLPQGNRKTYFHGASSFENDFIDTLDRQNKKITPGQRVFLGNVNGYSYAWNKSFNGLNNISFLFF